MASLSATTSYACQGTTGIITLDSLADAPGAPAGGAYSWTVVNQATGTDYGGPVEAGDSVAVPDGVTDVRVHASYPGGSTASSTPRSYTVNCGGNGGGGGGGGTGPGNGGGGGGGGTTPTYGCMAPNALNYDASATQDTSPTSCVFVEAGSLPALAAAHLPLLLTVRASPTLTGLAAIVVLLLQTAPATTTPDAEWQEFGRLRAVCDADNQAADFNLSEAAKSLLRIAPPVESGTDASLSALLRVRYQVLDPVSREEKYSGLVGTCRVLNSVVQPILGALLTTPTPYDSLPMGAALWSSTATLAGGVVSTAVTKTVDGCLARQFVWLNAKGGWDSGFFYGRHQHGTDIADPLQYRDLAGADRWASRGTVRPTLAVYSDKLDRPTYSLLRGIRLSVQVYERLGAGQYVPVLVAAESYSEYQEQTDKTFEVNFTVSYSAQLVQTQ